MNKAYAKSRIETCKSCLSYWEEKVERLSKLDELTYDEKFDLSHSKRMLQEWQERLKYYTEGLNESDSRAQAREMLRHWKAKLKREIARAWDCEDPIEDVVKDIVKYVRMVREYEEKLQ